MHAFFHTQPEFLMGNSKLQGVLTLFKEGWRRAARTIARHRTLPASEFDNIATDAFDTYGPRVTQVPKATRKGR